MLGGGVSIRFRTDRQGVRESVPVRVEVLSSRSGGTLTKHFRREKTNLSQAPIFPELTKILVKLTNTICFHLRPVQAERRKPPGNHILHLSSIRIDLGA